MTHIHSIIMAILVLNVTFGMLTTIHANVTSRGGGGGGILGQCNDISSKCLYT